jgi:hypothetical protein
MPCTQDIATICDLCFSKECSLINFHFFQFAYGILIALTQQIGNLGALAKIFMIYNVLIMEMFVLLKLAFNAKCGRRVLSVVKTPTPQTTMF